MIEFNDIININNINYKHAIININNLLIFLEKENIKKSFIQIIASLRNGEYSIQTIIDDHHKNKKNTYFFILFTNNFVLHIERLVYSDNSRELYIDLVHTDSFNRKKGLAYTSLFIIIENTKICFNVYELRVLQDNITAIKLYEKLNFKIIGFLIIVI